MNKFIISGNITAAPEMRTAGETSVAAYTVAVNRRVAAEGRREADFIRCTAFGGQATFAEKYFEKGTSVNVVGHIQTGSYTDKEGKTVYTTNFIVEEHEFAGRKVAAAPAAEA